MSDTKDVKDTTESIEIDESILVSLDAIEIDGEPIVETIKSLTSSVKERGFITSGEIFAALANLEPSVEVLATIYEGLRKEGIEVVDEIHDELKREDERRLRDVPVAVDRRKSAKKGKRTSKN